MRVGEESVFGRISQYFGAVETNEHGPLHLHGLLWLQGNMHLSSLMTDVQRGDKGVYRERVVDYIDRQRLYRGQSRNQRLGRLGSVNGSAWSCMGLVPLSGPSDPYGVLGRLFRLAPLQQ